MMCGACHILYYVHSVYHVHVHFVCVHVLHVSMRVCACVCVCVACEHFYVPISPAEQRARAVLVQVCCSAPNPDDGTPVCVCESVNV